MSIDSRATEYGKIFGDWMLHEMIGKGSNGRTAVFRITRNNRTYEDIGALKVVNIVEQKGSKKELSEEFLQDYEKYCEEFCEKAENELSLMNLLGVSGNIVSYHDHRFEEWEDDYSFGIDLLIRMDLLESLDKTRKMKSLNEQEILKIGMDISMALICCHEKGILHRDIKPDNIFFNKYSYMLGDFGISKMMSSHNAAETRTGTEAYAAPEQFIGHYDHRVDIYSLGLTLYELANGNKLPFAKTPFAGPEEIQMRLNGKELPKPDGISDDFAKVILKACAYNQEERYSTAAEFYSELENVANNTEPEVVETNKASKAQFVKEEKKDAILMQQQVNILSKNTVSKEKVNMSSSSMYCGNMQNANIRNTYAQDTNTQKDNQKKVEVQLKDKNVVRNKQERKKRGTIWKVLVVGMVLCIIVAGSLGFLWFSQQRTVPKLNNITIEEATRLLQEQDLNIEEKQEYSNTTAKGVIISQNVEEGTSVIKGTVIQVVVSKGQEQIQPKVSEVKKVVVPNLQGLMQEEVMKLCEELGMQLQISEEYSDSIKKGVVISQEPKADIEMEIGSRIQVVVSKGSEKVTVPNVIGLKEASAKKALRSSSLKCKIVKKYSSSIKEGKVIKQSIEKGSKVKKKTVVKLIISKGKKVTAPLEKTYVNPTATPIVSKPTKTVAPKEKEQPKKTKNSDEDDFSEWDSMN